MQLGVRHSPQFPLCQKCFKTVFKRPDESGAALIFDLKEWDERVLDCKINFSSLPACMWCFKGHLLSSFLRVPVIFPSTCFADVRAWRFKHFESFPCKCLWVFSHFYISCFPAASLCLFQVFFLYCLSHSASHPSSTAPLTFLSLITLTSFHQPSAVFDSMSMFKMPISPLFQEDVQLYFFTVSFFSLCICLAASTCLSLELIDVVKTFLCVLVLWFLFFYDLFFPQFNHI